MMRFLFSKTRLCDEEEMETNGLTSESGRW